jgi:hypothetical protein
MLGPGQEVVLEHWSYSFGQMMSKKVELGEVEGWGVVLKLVSRLFLERKVVFGEVECLAAVQQQWSYRFETMKLMIYNGASNAAQQRWLLSIATLL